MPKLKNELRPERNKGFFRPVHLQAAVVIIAYYFVSNFIFVGSLAHPNILISFFAPLVFGTLSTFVFLYLFSHKDFFHFMASLESQEKKAENNLLSKFGHYGNIIACMVVSAVGGPIILALVIRFIFPKRKDKYLIAFISVLVPTLIMVSFAKGFIKLMF